MYLSLALLQRELCGSPVLIYTYRFHHITNFFFFSFFLIHLTYSRWTSSLPSCLWSQRIFPSLPGSRLTFFYRDASSALLQLANRWFYRVLIGLSNNNNSILAHRVLYLCLAWCPCIAIDVSVCVCVCFLPIHSGHQVRWTYQPGSHRRKVTQDF